MLRHEHDIDDGSFQLPIIDLACRNKDSIPNQIIRACQEYGFFKVINHGVPHHTVIHMEQEARQFFSKSDAEKRRFGPANPYGYGCNTIGPNGDTGQLEYLLFKPNSNSNSNSNSDMSPYVSNDDNLDSFRRDAVRGYVEVVKDLACEILDHIEEGLVLGLGYRSDSEEASGESSSSNSITMKMSGLIKDPENDCVFRVNHYPPFHINNDNTAGHVIGFGEHTDPQLLTILRSNAVEGLQISLKEGVWLPVTPYPPSSFCVNVGDALQVMTNGRFKSVKHRVVVVKSSYESRLSMAYFCAPPLQTSICCLPGLRGMATFITSPPVYRSFTWAEYKAATYAGKLSDDRLNHFRLNLPADHKSYPSPSASSS